MNKEIQLNLPIKKLNKLFSRARGLMFKKEPLQDYGILLIPCRSIHMFIMFQSIDVIFLDRDFVVISTFESAKPNQILYEKQAYAVLELPLCTIQTYQIRPGVSICLDSSTHSLKQQ